MSTVNRCTSNTTPPVTVYPNGNSVPLSNGNLSHAQQSDEQRPNNNSLSPPSLPPLQTSSNNSRMSINNLCIKTPEAAEDEILDAAEVLENLRRDQSPHSTPLEPSTSVVINPVPSSPTTNGFIGRLPGIPIVSRAMNMYQQGKANSAILKYSAETIESSIKAISRPLATIPQIEQLDEYACRGLDKLEQKFPGVMDSNSISTITQPAAAPITHTGGFNGVEDNQAHSPTDHEAIRRQSRNELSRSSSPSYRPASRPHRTSQSNGSSNFAPYSYHGNNTAISTSSTASAPRSRWQQIVVGTGTVMGGVGAVVSEESMKSLKYCLQWLNYANQHIEHQMSVLREFIVNLTNPSSVALIHTSASSTLSSIKREVVETLRKVVEVVSKYAGACLPEQARENVRRFILSLPNRWDKINRTETSATPSPMASPLLAPANKHPLNTTTDYARRLLRLANESLDMLKGVAIIFGETVERAQSWVDYLQAMGVTSRGAAATGELQFDNIPQVPAGWKNGNGYFPSINTTNSSSTRNRRLSNGVRMSPASTRKHLRPSAVSHDEEDLTLNEDCSSSSDESEAENMRMDMNGGHHHIPYSARTTGIPGIKKRAKKSLKKEEEKMDLS
ncbi:hypothetical protein G9A89_015097 [Geosiphon pyriformis]|nr:hypothetical protein G9A89_015097 [Geosiphon pyriformis]